MSDAKAKTYPLHDAVLREDIEEVTRLLNKGANPNTIDEGGMTPLLWAVYGGYSEIVELLCSAGANTNLRASTGETPLWHAEDDFGLYEIAAILRRFGANIK